MNSVGLHYGITLELPEDFIICKTIFGCEYFKIKSIKPCKARGCSEPHKTLFILETIIDNT